MLTVRIVKENGHEILEEVDLVVFYPASETGGVPTVCIFKETRKSKPDDPNEEITSGHIYVMNEMGKTVATYHLFEKPLFEPFTKEQEKVFDDNLEENCKSVSPVLVGAKQKYNYSKFQKGT